MKKGKVMVIGLTGQTAFFKTDHFPAPGETVTCESLFFEPGGKGHNQAVACARMGVETVFAGTIGQDSNGQECRKALEQEGIVTCLFLKEKPTAYAAVTRDKYGENIVEVFGGASCAMNGADLDGCMMRGALEGCSCILVQNELPSDCLVKAAEIAREMNIPIIFNPAPAAEFSVDFLRKCSVITPNYGEARIIAGYSPEDEPDEAELWSAFQRKGISNVIVTMGSRGVLLCGKAGYRVFPAYSCGETVDTTGAGDTFNGVLTAFLAQGKSMEEAVCLAVVAAGISVTKSGAAGGMPTREEVLQHLNKFICT